MTTFPGCVPALQPGLRHFGDTRGQDLGQKQHCPQRKRPPGGRGHASQLPRRMLAPLLCLYLNFLGLHQPAPQNTPLKLLTEGVTPTVSSGFTKGPSEKCQISGRMAEGRSWDSGSPVLSRGWARPAGSCPQDVLPGPLQICLEQVAFGACPQLLVKDTVGKNIPRPVPGECCGGGR